MEGGPFRSRRPYVPGDSSGVTIGRGYDMKHRSQRAVRDDLTAAGVDSEKAAVLCRAAGLKDETARAFNADRFRRRSDTCTRGLEALDEDDT